MYFSAAESTLVVVTTLHAGRQVVDFLRVDIQATVTHEQGQYFLGRLTQVLIADDQHCLAQSVITFELILH